MHLFTYLFCKMIFDFISSYEPLHRIALFHRLNVLCVKDCDALQPRLIFYHTSTHGMRSMAHFDV